ncbi:MAG: AraC family transcriptional regulator [Sedimentisphaeraceae bacterium JB056]
MNFEQAAKEVNQDNKGREKFIIEKVGGYCPHVDLNAKLGLVLVCYQKDLPGVADTIKKYPFYRLGYTTQGKVVINDTKKEYTITGGTFYAFKPGETSFAKSIGNSNWSHYVLNFIGPEADELIKASGILEERVVSIKDQNTAENILRSILDERLKNAANSQTICEYYLKILLLNLSDWIIDIKKVHQTDYDTFIKCKNYIDSNFIELVSVESIAANCNISQQHLGRLFKKYTQKTPLNYLQKLKMNRASVMLIETNLSIAQIAYLFSFNDQFYFSKVFKKTYGISPQEYRSTIFNKLSNS